MRFYVSWYPGDPCYPAYDDDCSLLISITSVARNWTIRSLAKLPRRLLLDSGGYRFAIAPQEALPPKKVLERQLKLLADTPIPTIVCARDYPILNRHLSTNQKDKCISQTIAFAYELKNLCEQKNLAPHITPLAVVQGDDVDSLLYCAHELCAIGFPLYGIGSLAILRQHAPVMERVKAVADVVGAENLHIFGVSIIQSVQLFRQMGIHSTDSSRPAKAAAHNEIFYSHPFRRFGIVGLSQSGSPKTGRLPKARRLSNPLPCDCPVCCKDASQILKIGKRANIRRRAFHNYYHLKRTFCA